MLDMIMQEVVETQGKDKTYALEKLKHNLVKSNK